jgi:hypothetical protein
MKEIINLIENTFNCDITSLYTWKKEIEFKHKSIYKNI